MKGQWIGKYTGASTGSIIVNIDELSSYFQGIAYLFEDNKNIPSVAAYFRTIDKNNEFQVRTGQIKAINPSNGFLEPWINIKQYYSEDVFVSDYAYVHGACTGDTLTLTWTSERGASGSCTLPRSQADQPSNLVARGIDWDKYKADISSLKGSSFIFRGQNKPSRLRTSFHRTGRADLERFLDEDIQSLHRHLSSRTRHVFNLEVPNENGAFFNLVQHHGYPTPLLDWTYSPYVAAFFAYRGLSKEQVENALPTDKVRIYVFNQGMWKSDLKPITNLLNPSLHLSVGEFMAIENERMIPQQATSTVTNIDDIESYIKSFESPAKTYLSAIDLPVRDRDKVIQELRYMGITAGSMFPGLDGACEELKERNFEI
ncbi:FRG domain-containing protein [Candidatus Roizmanbacteria bacterium]|nr:FRG domain-containing protein [Candidatus Roizmanbacteria bacterium]